MIDPIGLAGAGQAGQLQNLRSPGGAQPAGDPQGPSFKDVLLDNLREVNQLQQDATHAIEDLHAGRRDDIETVLMATQKADTAFRMLQAVRNKVMDAYAELQQFQI